MQRVFIGDVQGCADELDEMLARAHARFGDAFEAWTVGDLVNRGPHNRRVLERVRALRDQGRARTVLGNHEIGAMLKFLGLRPMSRSDTIGEILHAPDGREWIEWLRRLPLVEVGEVAGEPFALVHASVHPKWSRETLVERAREAEARLRAGSLDDLADFLAGRSSEPGDRERLDVLGRLTRCRSVPDAACETWSDAPPVTPERAWHACWRRVGHDWGVVYGHWALQGLHVAPGLRGLDTGCVHHGRPNGRGGTTHGTLTAWVPDEAQGFAVPDARFWQVAARRRYIADDG